MKIKYKILAPFYRKKSKIECHQVLLKSNSYYKNLSEDHKANFQLRTLLFISTTNFSSEPDFIINKKMKIIISSAFVQITFGLKTDTLNKFNDVFVAPSSYSYKNNTAVFKGDVNIATKKVNMSWPAIEKGFKITDDALNLSIHEFGHCLIFENHTRSYFSKIFNKGDFENWKNHAKTKFQKVKAKENIVLRDYAATNLVEFFSVSLETFFEQAAYFKENEPELYESMTQLLKQDPINKKNPIL
ncbi:zinc-dependent peptidase [Polaribacter sp. 20A6]|uniref:zinc-dependent peptidase n=1 Tax=Polaribacter sp. 20A6 TaxID=2687289 RepID=UPI0013FDD3ED|nr:zinc-dependent peptidase [Polaribacter sp. 20A6]